jgi:hypothetical protein
VVGSRGTTVRLQPAQKPDICCCAVAAAACCFQAASGAKELLSILHRKAEDTQLPAGSFDVVSMCLVAHELPQHATKAILKEAYRWEAFGNCILYATHVLFSTRTSCCRQARSGAFELLVCSVMSMCLVAHEPQHATKAILKKHTGERRLDNTAGHALLLWLHE